MVQSELLLGYGLNDLKFESWQGLDFTKHTLALGPSQPPIQQALGFPSRDKGLWHEVDHTPPSSAEAIKAWSCTSTPPTCPHSVDWDNLFFSNTYTKYLSTYLLSSPLKAGWMRL